VSFDDPDGGASRRHPSCLESPTVDFAHPSERVLANLMTLYGVAWRYEPVEFPLAWDDHGNPIRGFRPDFYLPEHHLFVELTVSDQRLVTKKNQKVRAFRALYPELEIVVVYQRDFVALLRRHALGTLGNVAA